MLALLEELIRIVSVGSVIFRMSTGGFKGCIGTWGVLEAEVSVRVNNFCSSKNRCCLFLC